MLSVISIIILISIILVVLTYASFAVIPASIIGLFFFIGAPIYGLLNIIEKTKDKIKDGIKEKRKDKVFERYTNDTIELMQKLKKEG